MTEHVEIMNAPGNRLESRIDAALAFATELFELNPSFLPMAPGLRERLVQMQGQSRSYLAHEYFNRDWSPMHFGELAESLDVAKVRFVCSADLLSEFDAINFSKPQLDFLEKIDDDHFRETVKDFFRGTQFRKDYWAKGHLLLSPSAFKQKMREQCLMLISSPDKVKFNMKTRLGEVQLDKSIYEPILNLLANKDKVYFADIEDSLVKAGAEALSIAQATFVLVAKGDVLLSQPSERISMAKVGCERLNRHLISQATARNSTSFLSSPVLGRGIFVPRIHQIFIQALLSGGDSAESLTAYADTAIRGNGARVFSANSGNSSPIHSIDELKGQATLFLSDSAPGYRRLGILPS
jgi:hypothetical protein